YAQLLAVSPTPVVALNRAIAVAEVEGPAPALALLDKLDLERYHLFPAARADLLGRRGRFAQARLAYDQALDLPANGPERDLLSRRRAAIGARPFDGRA